MTSADFIPAAGAANAYCKVVGQLNPVDPLSWPILFEINLPEGWNGKAVQYGGGGTTGTGAGSVTGSSTAATNTSSR